MSEPDDWDDPSLGRPRAGPSFWATVRWRWRLGLFVVVATTGFTFVLCTQTHRPADTVTITSGTFGVMTVLWVGSRVLWAWLEWPSKSQPVRWLKAMLRVLLFDAEAERRAAGDGVGGGPESRR